MRILRFFLFAVLVVFCAQNGLAQNKKLDKTLVKVERYYQEGEFEKAQKTLSKLRKGALKISRQNNYLVEYHLREARIALALGLVDEFEKTLNMALEMSKSVFGESSSSYAATVLEVGRMHLEYGNFRLAREHAEESLGILKKTDELTEALDAEISLVLAEAMIGQGFAKDAVELLTRFEQYFAARASDRETLVENGQIKNIRLDADEIYRRHNDYVHYRTLFGMAYAKMGRIAIPGATMENPDVDAVFRELESWTSKKRRYLGPTSLSDIRFRYLWAKALEENGSKFDLGYDRLLNDLKRKKTAPTHPLAHDVYQSYIASVLAKGNRARYNNAKLEYEKMIERKYPKKSLHRINLKAIEFNAKLSRDRTSNLENEAVRVVASKDLPRYYKTRITVLEFLYQVAITEKRYGNAEAFLNQLAEIRKELCGESSPEYHLALISLANFYIDYTNKIEEAGKIYTDSYYGVVKQQIDVQHKDLINILNHLAQWYEITDNHVMASASLKEAKEAATYKFKNTDISYGIQLNQIARLQLELGEYEEAEANINRALEVIDLRENRSYEEYGPAYIAALETQAKLYGIKGLFDEAEYNLARTRRMIARASMPLRDEASTAKELSSLYVQLGRYSETDKLLTKLISEYENLYGPNSLRLIDPLIDKGRILLARGDYTEADRTARRAHQIALSVYGETSSKTAPTLKLMSDINYTLGDYDKAEENISKALESQERQFGRKHVEVARSLAQLAIIRFYKGADRSNVEKIMLEARDIMAEKLGKDNPQYAEILKHVAVFYISEEKYDIAFNALTTAESIWREKTGSKNNINAASIFTLTGDVYYQLKNYRKAEEFYNRSKALYEKFFSSTHPEYVKVLSKLSKVYYMDRNYKQSKRYIEQSLASYEEFIKQYFPALSEREKAKYWNTIRGDFEFYNTLAFSNLEDFRDLTGKIYNVQLLTKALLLSSSIKIRERIMNSTDEELKNSYNEWVQKKELLTMALSMTPQQLTENEIDAVKLTQEVEALERDLSQKSELFGQNFETRRITWENVRQSLQPNEVAIEMVRYRHFNHTFTDSVVYAALYISKDFRAPRAVVMKDGHNMETRYFRYYRNAIIGKIHDQVSYDAFWKPIADAIGQASTIYLSADGIYNQINLEAIPSPDGRYVIDNSNIVLVSNTKDIYLRRIKSRAVADQNTASMFGNPRFYLTASTDSRAIAPLPGTEKEVNQLQQILRANGWTTSEYLGAAAAEEKIKELNSPKIFHVATHGLYRPTEEITLENQIERGDAILTQNPLMRTGLLLRGAGDLLAQTDHNYNMDNGILTAYEAMSLNLDKTDLVVLSACETGLGDLQAGEGVYGLQRAFLVAGAKALIMSMFKVDDEATQELMVKFYQRWISTNNLRESFIEAKKELRTKYPEPIYWGAFIMIGLE